MIMISDMMRDMCEDMKKYVRYDGWDERYER